MLCLVYEYCLNTAKTHYCMICAFKLATVRDNLFDKISNEHIQVYYPAGSTSPGQSPRGGLGLYASPVDLVSPLFSAHIPPPPHMFMCKPR